MFLVSQIKKLTNPKRKLLHFGEGSALPGLLLELPPSKIAKSTITDYPAISALGFCCAELRTELEDHRPRQEVADAGYGEEFDWGR